MAEKPLVEGIYLHDKTTKGSFRYASDDADSPVGTVYIKKFAFKGVKDPEKVKLKIVITVE